MTPSQDVAITERLNALSCSAAAGQTGAACALLGNGHNINECDGNGHTPVMLAVLGGHLDTAVQLALNGADLACRNSDGRTALELAVLCSNREVPHAMISTMSAAHLL